MVAKPDAASRARAPGIDEIELHLRPERGECAALDIGCVSVRGRLGAAARPNEDYVGMMPGDVAARAARGSVIALADGMSGGRGARVAAELSVRAFIDAYYGLPHTLPPETAAARSLEAIHGWIHQIGRTDASLSRMAASFAALIVRRASACLVAAGDVRLYLLRDGQLAQLGSDDAFPVAFGAYVSNAVGLNPALVTRIESFALGEGDRLLLCSDGLYARVPIRELQRLLATRTDALDTARRLASAALGRGAKDDVTAAVLDVRSIPAIDVDYLERVIGTLPILPVPDAGDVIDGYRLDTVLSDSAHARLFIGRDPAAPGKRLVFKFPKPRAMQDDNVRQSIARERWLAGELRDPAVLAPLPIDAARQSRLYVAMPFCDGVTLEKLIAANPAMPIPRALAIAQRLGRAIAALNRRHVFHRDIKPENVLVMSDDEIRLIDFGFARMPGLDVPGPGVAPGTPAYMAPELMRGEPGDARSEVFAYGVTLYRLFSGGKLPYGLNGRVPLMYHRPDAPQWLDLIVEKATQPDPSRRYQDVLEVCADLERYAAKPDAPPPTRNVPWIERDPLRFWQVVSALLLLSLLAALVHGH